MDRELATARLQCKLAYKLMQARLARIDAERPRLSRHYSTLAHTVTAVALLEGVVDHLDSDPDLWDQVEPEFPF